MSMNLAVGDRIKKNANHAHGSGASEFTAGYWIKPMGSSNFTNDDISNHNGLLRHRGATGNVPQERLWTNPSGVLNMSSSTAFTNDAWNFVVVTSNAASGQKVYLNGVEVASASVLEPLATIANTADYFGDAVDATPWDVGDSARIGGIFRIAGDALTLAEVQALYANRAGGGGTTKPQDFIASGVTVSCAAFDQTTGNVTDGDSGLADLGDVANNWVIALGAPTWVDDDPGHNWSASEADPEATPYVVQDSLVETIRGGDLALFAWGDSFNQILDARAGQALFWATEVFPPVIGFAMGHNAGNAARPLRVLTAQEATGTAVKFEATGSTTYQVMNAEDPVSRFGVPIETIGEFHCNSTLALVSGTQFSRYDIRNRRLGEWGSRKLLTPNSRLRGRLILLGAVTGKQLADIKLVDPNGSLDQQYDLTVDGCRSLGVTGTALAELTLGATYPDFTLEPGGTSPDAIQYQLSVQKGSTNPVGTDNYLDLAGLAVYEIDPTNARRRGTYWVNMSGNSWDLIHLVTDQQSTEANSKYFTDDQLLSHIYATCIDPDMRPVIAINYATEASTSGTVADYREKIDAIVTRLDALYGQVYTQEPLYLFLISMVHAIGSTTYENLVTRFTNVASACRGASDDNSRISYVSAAARMEYHFATKKAGNEAVRAAYTAWAIANGLDNIVVEGLGTGTVALVNDADTLVETGGELHIDRNYGAAAIARIWAAPISAAVLAAEESEVITPTPGNGIHIASVDVGASWAALAADSTVLDVTIIASQENTDPVSIRVNGGDAADMSPGATIELRGADLLTIEVSGSDGDMVLVAGNSRGPMG